MKKNNVSFFASVPALLWQVLFLCIPLLVIIFYSFTDNDVSGQITCMHYATLLQWPYFVIIFRSFLLAFLSACTCLCIGYPVAYFIALYARRLKTVLLFLLMLPFWTNFLVQVYAWFYVLEYHGVLNSLLLYIGLIQEPLRILNSLFAIFLLLVYCYVPFMIMPLYSILEKFDIRFLEASSDLGASRWQTFKRITLPLSYPGIQTGFFLVLVPAFGEFAIYALLGGDKYLSVGSLITYYFLVARNNGLGAAFTMLSGIVLFMILGLIFLGVHKFLIHKQRVYND